MAGTVGVTHSRGPLGVAADISKTIILPSPISGAVSTVTGALRWYNDTGSVLNINSIRASVGTAPTGATLICDVKINGTSAFATTTANRPTIAVSTNTATAGTPDTTTLQPGDYVTWDVLQVGSTVAGSNLTLSMVVSAAS